MKKRTRQNIFLFIGSLLVSILIAELTLRFYYSSQDKYPHSNSDDECMRNFYESHKHLSKEEIRIGTPSFDPHPLYGWTLKPGYTVSTENVVKGTSVENVLYAHNEQGMRSVDRYSLQKKSNRKRIAIIGDSFTYGVDVRQAFSYPTILDRLLPNNEVLNFGVEAYGVDQMYLRFVNEAQNYSPDVVVMGILIDDIRRAALECNAWLKPKFGVVDGKLELTNTPVPTPLQFMESYNPSFDSYLVKHILSVLDGIGRFERQYKEGFEILEYILADVKKIAEEEGFFLLVGVITSDHQPAVEVEYEEKLVSFLQDEDIAFVESKAAFSEASSEYPHQDFYLSTHFNNLGNALFAQEIKNALEEQDVTSKTPDYSFYYNEYLFFDIMQLVNKENEKDVEYITSYTANKGVKTPVIYAPYPSRT